MLDLWNPQGTAKAAVILPPPPEPDRSMALAGCSLRSVILRREASVLSTSYSTDPD